MVKYPSTGGGARERKSRRSGCLLLFLVVVAVVIAISLFNLLNSEPLQVSKETTYVTGPLASDGQRIDYFAVIDEQFSPDNAASEDNGFRLLVQHVVAASEVEPWFIGGVCQKLGLDADQVQPDLTYEEPYDFLASLVESEDFDRSVVEGLAAEEKLREGPAEDANRDDHEDEAPPASLDDTAAETDGAASSNSNGFEDSVFDALEVLSNRTSLPWTLDDLPMMGKWLTKNGPALDVLSEAVRKPTFHIPLVRRDEHDSLIGVLLPNVQAMRAYARGLSTRARYRLGTGDIDGAIDDIVSCKRLGRHVGHGATLVHLLVGIAIEGIADSVGIAAVPKNLPSKEQLQRLMQLLDDLPAKATLDEKIQFERYVGLDILQRMAHGEDSLDEVYGVNSRQTDIIGFLGFDWNIAAKRLNEHYDALLAGDVGEEFTLNKMALISRRARSELLADVLAANLLPALSASEEAVCRHQCGEQMKQVTLAMLVYECEHGTLPPAYSVDAQGNPLHSWRVLLLPYLGHDELHRKIRVDEPWDSEHNRALHGESVEVYRCPSVTSAQPGDTTYSVVVGPEMPFQAGEGKKLSDFDRLHRSLILLVERQRPVNWMEPTGEVPQSEADRGIHIPAPNNAPLTVNGITSPHPGGANFGFRDGSVKFQSENIDPESIGKMLRGTGPVDY